jgi:hypothetical protein
MGSICFTYANLRQLERQLAIKQDFLKVSTAAALDPSMGGSGIRFIYVRLGWAVGETAVHKVGFTKVGLRSRCITYSCKQCSHTLFKGSWKRETMGAGKEPNVR